MLRLLYSCRKQFSFSSSSIPLHTISLARIVIFMIAILAHGRQVEWTARLDFLWQLQASHEKREMAVLQESNKHILYNLLPAHVAAHFLDNQFRNNMVNILAVTHINTHYTKIHRMLVCFVHFTKYFIFHTNNFFLLLPLVIFTTIFLLCKFFVHFFSRYFCCCSC